MPVVVYTRGSGRSRSGNRSHEGFSTMSSSDDIPPEDRALFRTAVRDSRRLEHDRVEHRLQRPRPIPHSRIRDEAQVLRDLVSDEFHPADFETGEELSYLKPGTQPVLLKKLRRGQFSVAEGLDMHGMTVVVAKTQLTLFLAEVQRRGVTCVRIVHGKGLRSSNRGPVLKHKLNLWLRQREEVLAFCSARPNDGGTGAVYVLLRRLQPR